MDEQKQLNIEQSIIDLKNSIDENNKSLNGLYDMIRDQSIAINNLIMAYNQNAINGNATSNNTSSILKKMADMEIKIDNNDMPIQDVVDQLNAISLEISQLKLMIEEFNLYGGQSW